MEPKPEYKCDNPYQTMYPVSKEEKRLIDYIRALGWGEINVIVKSGRPVMIDRAREQTKLTD